MWLPTTLAILVFSVYTHATNHRLPLHGTVPHRMVLRRVVPQGVGAQVRSVEQGTTRTRFNQRDFVAKQTRVSFPRDAEFNFNFDDTSSDRHRAPKFHLPIPPDHPYHEDGEHQGLPFTPDVEQCYKPPLSDYFGLSAITYDYPKRAIFSELHKKPYVLRAIYQSARKARKGYADLSTNYKLDSGCKVEAATLEGFYFKGGPCWVLYPKYQNVQFVTCRYPQCEGLFHGTPRCQPEDRDTHVWAFCQNLPYGNKVAYMKIPLPVDCSCSVYNC